MPTTTPATVADAVTAGVRKSGLCNGRRTYYGVLRVKATWGSYTKRVGLERFSRQDAGDDADHARQDYIRINQLP